MRTHRSARPQAGFSLVETLIVVMIAGLLMLIVLPGLGGYRGTSGLRATSRQLVSDLRTAQQTAAAQGTQTDLVLATSGGVVTGYTVTQGTTVLWQVTLPSGVHATSAWPNNDIAFTSAGSVVGPGSAPAICLDNRNGAQITLGLVLPTGFVQMAQGTGNC